MITRLLLAFVFLAFSTSVNGFGTNFWKIKSMISEHRMQQAVKHVMRQQMLTSPGLLLPVMIDDMYMAQPIDHFNPLNQKTYRQRYWVNTEHWKHPEDGPVFLYIGGEGPLNSLCVQYGEHVDLAKKYGALLFGVEHRFYGESINDDGLQLDSLQYLSSQQALADIAHFHQVMSAKYNLTTKNKWIAYGGSYPGSLSAWIRIKYPHLIHASIASSAPVEAKVDFNGYNDVVAQSLSQQAVGGSDKCSAAVHHAFRQIDIMIAKGLHSQLARDFVSCAPIVYELDVYMFVSNLADIFMGIVQYNNEDLGGMNISVVCDMMTLQNRSAYGSLVQLHTQYLRFTSQNCTDNSWQSFMEQMSNVTVDRGALPSMRQWIYQTCSQFGYYQTCELTSSCLFSNLMLLRPNLEICHFIFNITSDEVYAQVDFTNAYYGSSTPEGNRILFVNGLIDPWHALSVLHNLSRSELVVIIPDTAHCANMHSDRDIDPPTLRDAKQRISEQVGIWLADDKIYPAKQIARKHFNLSNDILKNLR